MELNGQALTLEQIAAVAIGDEHVAISPSARPRIAASRKVIEQIVTRDAVVYGVNTGFGKLSDVRVPQDELRQLQLNLVRSHACGIGQPLSEPEVRAMMLLRANVLTLGFSGIRWDVIELLCEMLNRRVHPVVPEKGSVGASGDLAPLAHLALSVIGEGEVFFEGQRMATAEALRRAKLKALELEAKEGLALLNGTQAMHAVGGLALLRAQRLARVADVSGAMSLEALKGTPAAFDPAFAGRAAASGPESRGRTSFVPDGRQRDPSVASHRRPAGAGRIQPALHAPGARGGARRAGTL